MDPFIPDWFIWLRTYNFTENLYFNRFLFTFKVSREFCVNKKNNIIYPGLNAEDSS